MVIGRTMIPRSPPIRPKSLALPPYLGVSPNILTTQAPDKNKGAMCTYIEAGMLPLAWFSQLAIGLLSTCPPGFHVGASKLDTRIARWSRAKCMMLTSEARQCSR